MGVIAGKIMELWGVSIAMLGHQRGVNRMTYCGCTLFPIDKDRKPSSTVFLTVDALHQINIDIS